MSEDAPAYSLLLNGNDAYDYFTKLTTNRFVRQQVGNFSIEVDDDLFQQWAGLDKYQVVEFSINDTLIFKGRIDRINRRYQKSTSGGYLTTISGRDDGGALQDTVISGAYTDWLPGTYIGDAIVSSTPANILNDIVSKYNSRKGSNDPSITLGTVEFSDTQNYSYRFSYDRENAWQAIELLCEAVEAKYGNTSSPVFLDYWVDENDKLNLTPTGYIVDDIDAGDYGGGYLKIRDWTVDALPIKNDVWVYGAPAGAFLPLTADPYWVQVNGGVLNYAYTNATASQWFGKIVTPVSTVPTIQSVIQPWLYKTINPGPIVTDTGITISNSTNIPLSSPIGDQSIQVHIDPLAIAEGVLDAPLQTGSSGWLSAASVIWSMRFDPDNYGDGPWIGLCQQPRDHFNFHNNTYMNETMGEVNGFYATVQVVQPGSWLNLLDQFLGIGNSFACDIFCEAVDGQPWPMKMASPLAHYSASNFLSNFEANALPSGWATLFWPLGPTAGGTLGPTNQGGFQTGFFNWDDVQEIHFGVNLNFFTAFPLFAPFDIYFADLYFTKQIVAQRKPVPTDTTRTSIVTDTTIPNYLFASNRATAYGLSLALPQSYIDYDIFGRPDLQVGHVFTAEGIQLLIREATTTVVKNKGYGVHVKAWKELGT